MFGVTRVARGNRTRTTSATSSSAINGAPCLETMTGSSTKGSERPRSSEATAEAMAAFQPTVNCRVLIDGLKLRGFPYPHEGVVHGDGRSLCIAMASIAAKVTRDRAMIAMEGEYPGYGFAGHKGYGTEEHRVALLRQGRCFQHRDKFVRSFLEGKRHDVAGQLGLFGELEPKAE